MSVTVQPPSTGAEDVAPEPGRVAAEDARPAGEAECLDIAADQAAGRGVLLDEEHMAGAPRQRLDPDGPTAGEQVGHQRTLEYPGADERVEDGLADPVVGPVGEEIHTDEHGRIA